MFVTAKKESMSDEDDSMSVSSDNSCQFIESISDTSLSQNSVTEEEVSFASVTYDQTQNLKEVRFEELDKMMRKTYDNNTQHILPPLFIKSLYDLVNENDPTQQFTYEQLDSKIQQLLFKGIDEDKVQSKLENLLILKAAFLDKTVRGQSKHIEAIKAKEMDLAKTELTELEQKLQRLAESLQCKDNELQQTRESLKSVETIATELQATNNKLKADVTSIKEQLTFEQSRYIDLMQESEMDKIKYMTMAGELEKSLSKKDTEIRDLRTALEKEKLLTVNNREGSDKMISRLKAKVLELQQRQGKTLDGRDYKEWYIEQITALEADRDMFYYKSISQQDELSNLTQEYETCMREKDAAIEAIRQQLENSQAAIRDWTLKFTVEHEEKSRISKRLQTRENHIQALQDEFNKIEGLSIWKKFDEELTGLQCRMDYARNITPTGKHILSSRVYSSPVGMKSLDLTRFSPEPVEQSTPPKRPLPEQISPIEQVHIGESPSSRYGKQCLHQVQFFSQAVKRMEMRIIELEQDNNLLNATIENMSSEFHTQTHQISCLELDLKRTEEALSSANKEIELLRMGHQENIKLTDNYLQQRKLLQEKNIQLQKDLDSQRHVSEKYAEYKSVRNDVYKKKIRKLKNEILNLRSKNDAFAKLKSEYERRIATILDDKQDAEVQLLINQQRIDGE